MNAWETIKSAFDYGAAFTVAIAAIVAVGYILVRLFGKADGILTRLGRKAEAFFERYCMLADKIEPNLQKQSTIAERMLRLHEEPSSPCNTLPLRHAGLAAAAAIEAIGESVGADVRGPVERIRVHLKSTRPIRE